MAVREEKERTFVKSLRLLVEITPACLEHNNPRVQIQTFDGVKLKTAASV